MFVVLLCAAVMAAITKTEVIIITVNKAILSVSFVSLRMVKLSSKRHGLTILTDLCYFCITYSS